MISDAELRRIVERHVRLTIDEYDLQRLRLRERLADISTANPALRNAETVKIIRKFGRDLRSGLLRLVSENTRELETHAVREISSEFGISRLVLRNAVSQRSGRLILDDTIRRMVSTLVVDFQRRAMHLARRTPNVVAHVVAARQRSRAAFFERQVALVARVESFRAYNESVVDSAVAVKSAGGPRIRKRISEIRDRNNHPFSRAADGATAPVDRPFRVSAADVAQAASAMGRSANGVFWVLNKGYYEGHTLPAHFNDRGRVILEVV